MADKKSKPGLSAMPDIDAIGSKLRQACLASVEVDESLMFVDGHDDAIVGVAERDGVSVVVYDSKKVVRRLRAREGAAAVFEIPGRQRLRSCQRRLAARDDCTGSDCVAAGAAKAARFGATRARRQKAAHTRMYLFYLKRYL